MTMLHPVGHAALSLVERLVPVLLSPVNSHWPLDAGIKWCAWREQTSRPTEDTVRFSLLRSSGPPAEGVKTVVTSAVVTSSRLIYPFVKGGKSVQFCHVSSEKVFSSLGKSVQGRKAKVFN